MDNFRLIAKNIDVSGVLEQLTAHPELWNQYTERKAGDSPHKAMTDIWVRFRPKAELVDTEDYKTPHIPEWYPSRRLLPDVERISLDMLAKVRGVQLGGVLITKIPPGGKILPHHDRGRWHAEFYNTKIYVPIQSNPDCINICEEDKICMRPGEAWFFDNLKVHSVENNGNVDRITLIVCVRVEP